MLSSYRDALVILKVLRARAFLERTLRSYSGIDSSGESEEDGAGLFMEVFAGGLGDETNLFGPDLTLGLAFVAALGFVAPVAVMIFRGAMLDFGEKREMQEAKSSAQYVTL